METFGRSLGPGDRLVANALTIESKQMLFQHQGNQGGPLTRLAIHRAEPVGKFLGRMESTGTRHLVGCGQG
ncbi:MAG TPA: hypothetical protein V6D27_15980, partial [Vampirovibrionales bacterium]